MLAHLPTLFVSLDKKNKNSFNLNSGISNNSHAINVLVLLQSLYFLLSHLVGQFWHPKFFSVAFLHAFYLLCTIL